MSIIFLGELGDLAGTDRMDTPAPLDWEGLLFAVGQPVADRLLDERVRIACAGRVLAEKTALAARDGEEVALLPPVSGG